MSARGKPSCQTWTTQQRTEEAVVGLDVLQQVLFGRVQQIDLVHNAPRTQIVS
jgi:hypothetical protein